MANALEPESTNEDGKHSNGAFLTFRFGNFIPFKTKKKKKMTKRKDEVGAESEKKWLKLFL